MQYILEQKEVKKEQNSSHTWKCLALFLIGWIGLNVVATIIQFFVMIFQNVPFGEAINFILKDIKTESVIAALGQGWVNIFVNALAYLIIATLMILILNKSFLDHLKTFENGKAIIAGFVGYFLIIVFNIVYRNLVQPLYPVSDNLNEASLDSIIVIYPVISIIIFGIVGPVCEELTYRVGLFSLIKKKSKTLGYVLTIIFFGFIHFAFESVLAWILLDDASWLINELLNMPTYMFAAAVFIYLFDNYGFAGSTSAHIFNNLVSIITQIIISKL